MMHTLQTLRQEIDQIDNSIIDLFVKRFLLVKNLGKIKKEEQMPIQDIKREEEKIHTLIKKGEGLSEKFIRDIWQRIFSESYTLEA